MSYCGVFGKFRGMGGDDLVNDVIDLFRDALHALCLFSFEGKAQF